MIKISRPRFVSFLLLLNLLCRIEALDHFTFWISLSLIFSLTNHMPCIIADVIGDSSLISPYFFVYFLISDKVE